MAEYLGKRTFGARILLVQEYYWLLDPGADDFFDGIGFSEYIGEVGSDDDNVGCGSQLFTAGEICATIDV